MPTGVIIAGAGPVGLMLAGELRLAGVEVTVYEKLARPSGESRGVGFTRRTAEVFDQRGLLSSFGEIEIGREGHFGGVRVDFTMLEDNYFGIRGVPQHRIERVLGEWVAELGATVLWDHEVVGFRETEDGITVAVRNPRGEQEHEAAFLVGCDGGRSTVRKLAGIDFPGHKATRGMYVADVVGCDIAPHPIGRRVEGGMVMAIRLEENAHRIIIHPDDLEPRDPATVTFDEIADSWQKLTGQDLHGAEHTWVSCFTNATRQAAEYRRGRVLLCGDATHIHIPAGAQGLSVGVQDAVNLGWKLAATVQGRAPEGLLDTFEAERHPVGKLLLRNTLAQARLYLTGDEMEPLREVMRELATYPDAAKHLAGLVSGLSVRYDVGAEGHPLLGLRMPDHELKLADGRGASVFTLLHKARGVLLRTSALDAGAVAAAAGWADLVDVVEGEWAPGTTGGVARAPHAVLLRPDGHVVWAAPDGGDLAAALERWFGRPSGRA